MSISDPVYDLAMHDPLRRKAALSFLLLMLAIAQIPPRAPAGSLSVSLVRPGDGAPEFSAPVNLEVIYTDSSGPVEGVPTRFCVKMPSADHFEIVGTAYSDAEGYASYDFPPHVPGSYQWYVNYTDTGQDVRYPSSGMTWTFSYVIQATTTSTTAQWITTAYTRTVGIVTEFSYLYETATSGTTTYITRTISTTTTMSLPTTLTRTSTAFLTTQTTPVTYYETQSTTLTEMSYATISVTQYVYVESYSQGQVLENATIQQISNGSEVSAHFNKGDEHDIQTITIGVINNVTNVKITIASAPQHSDVGMDTNEYGSFQILATNLSDNNVKSVVIEFKVDKNWLSSNQIPQDGISLYRYENGEWKRLETSLITTDETYAYYKATSPGLSIFAIAGQPSSFLKLLGIGHIADSYVMVLSLVVVAILGAYAAIRIAKSRSKRGKGERKSEPLSAESSPGDQIEKRLLEYITRHGGSISLSKAAEDLGVLPVTIKETISHLKSSGRLTPA